MLRTLDYTVYLLGHGCLRLWASATEMFGIFPWEKRWSLNATLFSMKVNENIVSDSIAPTAGAQIPSRWNHSQLGSFSGLIAARGYILSICIDLLWREMQMSLTRVLIMLAQRGEPCCNHNFVCVCVRVCIWNACLRLPNPFVYGCT